MSADPAAGAAAPPSDVLAFWRAAGPDKWFTSDPAFDREIATRFGAIWRAAADGQLARWEATPEGALALLIVLDQFPRNMCTPTTTSSGHPATAPLMASI